MSQILLDHSQRDTGFQQVRCVGMPQCVNRHLFAEIDLCGDPLHRPLHGAGLIGVFAVEIPL